MSCILHENNENERSSSFFFAPLTLLGNLNFFIQIFTVLIRKIERLQNGAKPFATVEKRKTRGENIKPCIQYFHIMKTGMNQQRKHSTRQGCCLTCYKGLSTISSQKIHTWPPILIYN